MYAPVERSKWTGLLQISAGVAATFGPTLVGKVTDNLSWRYFFWATIPVAIISGILVLIGVPSLTERTKHKIDYAGAFLLAVASSAMILGFSYSDRRPWISFYVLGLLILSLIFWCLFIWTERKVKEPILDPQVFENRTFLTAALGALLSFFGFMGIMNYYPLFLQGVQGTTADVSGRMLTPFSMLMAFMGVPAGLLIAKTKRYKWMLVLSYAVLTVAMFCMITFNHSTPLWLGVIVMILGGIGVGAIPTTNILLVQFALPKRLLGIAVAGIFFMGSIGAALAPAILGPAMNSEYKSKLEASLPGELEHQIDAATLESITDPSVLMDENAKTELKNAFNRVEGGTSLLYDKTAEAIRNALQSSLRLVFLIGAVAMLIATLFIATIPEVSMDTEVQDKKTGSQL